VTETTRRTLKEAYRILYRENLAAHTAIEKMKTELTMCPELDHLIAFVSASERGIAR